MPVFAEYALKETTSNLWRNRLMTMAAVLTVAVSLALVGSALLLKCRGRMATRNSSNHLDVVDGVSQ